MSTTIDDSDPRVQYAPPGAWQTAGGPDELNFTTHFTEQDGATATLVFTGNSVAVYGTIADNTDAPPATNFTVDGSNAATYSAVPLAGTIQYKQLFYSSPPLQNQQHTLVITKHLSSSELFLDYIVVNSPSHTSSLSSSNPTSYPPAAGQQNTNNSPSLSSTGTLSATSTSSSTSTNTGSTHLTTSLVNFVSPAGSVSSSSIAASSTSSSDPSSSSSSSSSPPAGAIVGGVLGGFILILAVVIIMLLRRYLRHRNPKSSSHPTVSPFHDPNQMYEHGYTSTMSASSSSPTRFTGDGMPSPSTRLTSQWLPTRKPPLGSSGATSDGHERRLGRDDAPPLYTE